MKNLIPKALAFFLVFGLLQGMSVFAEQEQSWDNRYGPLPKGKFVSLGYGYHDTWTHDWKDYDNKFTEKGVKNESNLYVSYDRGAPKSSQSNGQTLGFQLKTIKTNEDFQKHYRLLPLNTDSFKAMGMTEEQAQRALDDALQAGIPNYDIMGGSDRELFLQK